MDNFDPVAFEADPSAAFSDTMGAVMDFMGDSGMPPDMMDDFGDIAQGWTNIKILRTNGCI